MVVGMGEGEHGGCWEMGLRVGGGQGHVMARQVRGVCYFSLPQLISFPLPLSPPPPSILVIITLLLAHFPYFLISNVLGGKWNREGKGRAGAGSPWRVAGRQCGPLTPVPGAPPVPPGPSRLSHTALGQVWGTASPGLQPSSLSSPPHFPDLHQPQPFLPCCPGPSP